MKRLLLSVLPVVILLAAGGARGQDALGIVAVVNDKAISAYDLDMRLSLVMTFSQVADTAENRRRLTPQVLQTLIDEELKRQEAARLKIAVTDEEVDDQIRKMEEVNGLRPGGMSDLLANSGIAIPVLANWIRADIAWSKLIGLRFGRRFRVTDEEIDGYIAEIERNKGKPEHLVAEIFLPVDQPEHDAEVHALGTKLVQQARAGANFAALARNFSKSPSAVVSGDLGWVRVGQLGRTLDRTIAALSPGTIADPVRADDGYYILLVRDRRAAPGLDSASVASTVVNLQQFFLPIEPAASPSDIAAITEAAKKIGERAKSCEDLDKAGRELESPLSGNLGDVAVDALGPQHRSLVRGLPPLKASLPLRVPDGVIVLMVCRRDEPERAAVSEESRREKIAERLLSERLGLAARQHLRDLRRARFVEVRL